jgi:hypothetical protein
MAVHGGTLQYMTGFAPGAQQILARFQKRCIACTTSASNHSFNSLALHAQTD